jgi:Protein of unknown function (DUF3145)
VQRRSTQGVVFVHACPKALCQHVEWALERVVGAPVSLSWAEQPAAHGAYRAEVAWTGSPGTGARLVAALRAWPMLRFEVTEEASHGNDGERMSYVPGHGVFRAPTSANSSCGTWRPRCRPLRRSATASTSCSARRGTPTSRSTATPATAARSPGCTRSSEVTNALRRSAVTREVVVA